MRWPEDKKNKTKMCARHQDVVKLLPCSVVSDDLFPFSSAASAEMTIRKFDLGTKFDLSVCCYGVRYMSCATCQGRSFDIFMVHVALMKTARRKARMRVIFIADSGFIQVRARVHR